MTSIYLYLLSSHLSFQQAVALQERVLSSPEHIMKEMFMLQGIQVDPEKLEYICDRIVQEVDAGYGDGVSKFDCFINYRVAADRRLVKELYWMLSAKGIRPYLDATCLETGKDWKVGFLNGLRSSRTFIAVISRKALERPRMLEVDHSTDNVLLEYEMALKLAEELEKVGRTQFIIPLLVGEYETTISGRQALCKFSDHNEKLYSPSVGPIDAPTGPASPVPAPSHVPALSPAPAPAAASGDPIEVEMICNWLVECGLSKTKSLPYARSLVVDKDLDTVAMIRSQHKRGKLEKILESIGMKEAAIQTVLDKLDEESVSGAGGSPDKASAKRPLSPRNKELISGIAGASASYGV